MHAGTSGGSGKIEGRLPGGGHVDLASLEHGLSAAMLQGGKIDMLSPGRLPSIFPEPPDVPECITLKYSEVYETL